MTSKEIRQKFLEFMEKRGHAIVPSSSLVPTDDSVLLTTAGMQQFKPYYTGEKNAMEDFGSLNTASSQKCARTSDIEEVGDETHLTFFEMLGNFSFGGYFKKEAIGYAHEFITKEMGLKIDCVSVFAGDGEIPLDEESEKIWKEIDGDIEIKRFDREDNFWGPTGEEGPCGPTTEIYVNGVEIWNLVFNEYYCDKDGKFKKLETPGVDTGMGLERLAVAAQNVPSVFETDLFAPIMDEISKLAKENDIKSERIIADHVKAAVFMIADGVEPSKIGRGYVLRRLIRRAMLKKKSTKLEVYNLNEFVPNVIDIYKEQYLELKQNKEKIFDELNKEEDKFGKTLEKGLKELIKMSIGQFEKSDSSGNILESAGMEITGKNLFVLFSTYGFPLEISLEEIERRRVRLGFKKFSNEKIEKITKEFNEEMKKHQELSKTASAGMFKGGLADSGEDTAKLHTATHLLQAALKEVLGEHVAQKGSNINAERLRFDFSHPEKLTDEQKQKVEKIVNEKIKEDLPVICEETGVEEAKEKGAIGVFDAKYGDKVKVYSIGDSARGEQVFSREICGGPHVKSTGELGFFKIKKEEASSAGVRRIKAVLE